MHGKWLSVVVLASLMAGGAALGGSEKDAGTKELKKIQGTWQFTAHDMDGKPAPAEQVAKTKITFTGDKWTVRVGDQVVQGGTHKLDATKKPNQVDAQVTEGDGKGSTMLGIYELKGDSMKVCFDPQGKERPTGLTAKAGQFSVVIQREKKKQ